MEQGKDLDLFEPNFLLFVDFFYHFFGEPYALKSGIVVFRKSKDLYLQE